MKKLLIVLGIALLVADCKKTAIAEVSVGEVISKLPAINTGMFYNMNDSKIEMLSTVTLAAYKGVNLNLGWASKQSAVMSIAYTCGVNRLDDRNMEFINGPSVTLKARW
jgi:hypothetical protein